MELNQELKYWGQLDSYAEYVNTFIQRSPSYAVKFKGGGWRTKKNYLQDTLIQAHLEGQYYVGVLAKWYPGYCILDMDNVAREEPEKIRDSLKLDESNSMLLSSESDNSYHILLRPFYNNRPPTTGLLQNIFKTFGQENNIEIYPQPSRAIRLPFGHKQDCLDIEYIHLKNWKEKLYRYLKLDDFDLKTIPYQQQEFDLKIPGKQKSGAYQAGKELFETGLNSSSSRHDSQFYVLYYFWSRNIPPETALEMCYAWIRAKHNGYSKEVNSGNWRTIKQDIKRQAAWIYSTCEYNCVYPDDTHNGFNGYITKPDIADIVGLSKANLPRMNFLFHLVKFCYPRRYRNFLNIHSDKLEEWSKKNYLKYLEELNQNGIVNRGEIYQVKKFSKSIKINWNFKDPSLAILEDNRAPDTFKNTIKISYKPEEFRELLLQAGAIRTTAIDTVKRIF